MDHLHFWVLALSVSPREALRRGGSGRFASLCSFALADEVREFDSERRLGFHRWLRNFWSWRRRRLQSGPLTAAIQDLVE
jgi:hypothetical protein